MHAATTMTTTTMTTTTTTQKEQREWQLCCTRHSNRSLPHLCTAVIAFCSSRVTAADDEHDHDDDFLTFEAIFANEAALIEDLRTTGWLR